MAIRRCITIATTSRYVRAYFSLFLNITTNGKHSLSLWGPGDGFGACDTHTCSLNYEKSNDLPFIYIFCTDSASLPLRCKICTSEGFGFSPVKAWQLHFYTRLTQHENTAVLKLPGVNHSFIYPHSKPSFDFNCFSIAWIIYINSPLMHLVLPLSIANYLNPMPH
jgi:hypothetical protein